MKSSTSILLVALIAVVSVVTSFLLLNTIEATAQGVTGFTHNPISESYILIDDFKDGDRTNELGGKNDCFSFEEGGGKITCTIRATLEHSYVEIAYNVITDSANVWLQMNLGESGSYGNFLAMDAVQVVIKGESGGERIYVEFTNCGDLGESSNPKVEIKDHLVGGITTSWRAVIIPFSAFTDKLNDEQREKWSWSCLDRFAIIAHHQISSGIGKVFVDDVRAIASTVLVDDFHDQELENELGGASGIWTYTPTPGTTITPTFPTGQLKLAYNVPEGSQGSGFWTKLISTNLMSLNEYLLFDIRGEKGDEKIWVQFIDCGVNGYTHYVEIKVSDYLKREISTTPGTVAIPKAAFTDVLTDTDQGVDWNCVTQLTFNTSGRSHSDAHRGTVYIDNVRLVPAKAVPYRIPVWIDHFNDCDDWNALSWKWYTNTLNGASFAAVPDTASSRDNDGCGYHLTFNVSIGQSGWIWTEFKGFDATDYSHLEFYIIRKGWG